jgi:beta-galactosidase GanA
MNIHTWEEFYPRDGVTNPSYKNEWERYNRKCLADFLNRQCDIVNEYRLPAQFVTHCFMPYFHNIDQVESFRQMQYPAINVYHSVQDGQDGQWIAWSGDYMRTVSKGNYLVTETNAQGTGWDSRGQYPPYDGQLRQNVYSHLASGSNMVEYWHWHTLHYGQETYWRGILGQDLQPNRIYREFTATAKELKAIGKQLVNLKKDNKVAILYSHDSHHALNFMPYTNRDKYPATMIHNALLRKACGFYYQEYSNIPALSLKGNPFNLKNGKSIGEWYEFLIPETAKPLAYADHPFFGQFPAITENAYGKGNLYYIGTYPSEELLGKIVRLAAEKAGILTAQNEYRFPVIFRSGKNQSGKQIHYVFNYSAGNQEINCPFASGKELISGEEITGGQTVSLKPWSVTIIEE